MKGPMIYVAIYTMQYGQQLYWVDSEKEYEELYINLARTWKCWTSLLKEGKTEKQIADEYWKISGESIVCRMLIPYGSFKNETT